MFHSERSNQILNRTLQIIVLIYQGAALIVFAIIPFLAINWLRTPFIGAFVEQTMVFNGVGQESPAETWGLFQDKQLWLDYQLTALTVKK
jgi:hypothetical protein